MTRRKDRFGYLVNAALALGGTVAQCHSYHAARLEEIDQLKRGQSWEQFRASRRRRQ
jgi:hypothetical protein